MTERILEGSRILLVDDEELLTWSIETELKSHGADMITANSLKTAIDAFNRHQPDLVICDLRLPDGSGLELIKKWRHEKQDIPIILITAHGGIQSAIDALRLGAFDYLQKPFDLKSLLAAAKRATELSLLRAKVHRLTGHESPSGTLTIVGDSPQMKHLIFQLKAVATSNCSTVLILGESGTGKELAARAVHEWSKKSQTPFVEINCSSIPAGLLESELFGYEKGAFTDARDRKLGLFEMAGEGTIFLDEIGEMPINLQAKLLRVLESRRFKRLGGTKDIFFQSRIVAATNRNLLDEVAQGRFRGDLYYRIHTLPILLPPLRNRLSDLAGLSEFFIKKLAEELKVKKPKISKEALEKLTSHNWPGNVRELRNVLERSMVLSPAPCIQPPDIQFDKNMLSGPENDFIARLSGDDPLTGTSDMGASSGFRPSFHSNPHKAQLRDTHHDESKPTCSRRDRAKNTASYQYDGHQTKMGADMDIQQTAASHKWHLPAEGLNLESLEKQLIEQALFRAQNNQTRAAALLGISRHTFRYRLEKHGITGA